MINLCRTGKASKNEKKNRRREPTVFERQGFGREHAKMQARRSLQTWGKTMIGNTIRRRMLASTMLGGLALMAAGPALAQAAAAGEEVGEVVVTGSRIKRAETTTE